MIVYLTFNDPPTGVYASQVIDVVKFMRDKLGYKIRLVSFVSIRNYQLNKRKIKKDLPDALVLPMVPLLKNWKKNKILLTLILKSLGAKKVVARGPFATSLALSLKKLLGLSVVYDGRGAYSAEVKEYNVIEDENTIDEVKGIEKQSVLESDFRIAVSNKLIEYWENEFGYKGQNHVMIPCTLNSEFSGEHPVTDQSERQRLGFEEDDIILIYSGSSAGWQSFSTLDNFLLKAFEASPRIHCILLADTDPEKFFAHKKFPDRLRQMWVSHDEVKEVLNAGDYGLLIRDKAVTNEVASPTKFAEYLSRGLPVIISEGIGDFSGLVKDKKCGYVFSEDFDFTQLTNVSGIEKRKFHDLAIQIFTKESHKDSYKAIAES